MFFLKFNVEFTVVDEKDNKPLKDVQIKLGEKYTLETDENGKAITAESIDVGTNLSLTVSKEGFKGVDVPDKITVSELTVKNKITLKKTLKEVYL